MTNVKLTDTYLEKVDRRTADKFFAEFEILGDVGLGVWHWGLYYQSRLISVVTFGTSCFGGKRGWIGAIAKSNGVDVVQLCRGGTLPDAPKGTPSRAISLACRALREARGPFIAVAYSDESLGEIGTIYQACGALYSGMTNPKGQANYRINGRMRSAWSVRKEYGTRDRQSLAKVDPEVEVILLKPKHRYMLVVASRLARKKIIAEASQHGRPYPKRSID